ncbi:hypothetical protein FH966_06755 [Lentibacillus cibarius]|uniref:Uncharacterized protein n=2 Tax=Lentibacillus TaxID=175304 RepID=A0A549YHQ3_9BACI|nr:MULTISPECIES: hypothetical protein [Lentibacillus]TRM11419.1 hypothetical protein FH966_06755 [Lentibacillus cibarius]SFE33178.1 hypothetical protein SAMN05216238_1134 [Lentibacillus persicus]
MEKIIEGHLVGFGSLRDMEHLKDDYHGEFTDGGMSEINIHVYSKVPSKEQCESMCAKKSGEVTSYTL